MLVRMYTSRDLRTGLPLNVPRDGYRYEHPDIPLCVEVTRLDDDWDITAEVAEDLPRMDEEGNGAEGFLFRAGQQIALTMEEEEEAIEDYCRSERGIFD